MAEEQNASKTRSYLTGISEAERHFNEIESKYRALASTWLLASFAGMGFVIETGGFPIQKEVIIFAIALAGSFGIQLLWIIDVLVYHRLLDAYFLEGLRIEAENDDVPQVRWNMMEQGTVDRRIRLFYAGCSLILIPAGITPLLMRYSLTQPFYVSLLFAGIPLVIVGILWRKSQNNWLLSEIDDIGKDI